MANKPLLETFKDWTSFSSSTNLPCYSYNGGYLILLEGLLPVFQKICPLQQNPGGMRQRGSKPPPGIEDSERTRQLALDDQGQINCNFWVWPHLDCGRETRTGYQMVCQKWEEVLLFQDYAFVCIGGNDLYKEKGNLNEITLNSGYKGKHTKSQEFITESVSQTPQLLISFQSS